MKSILLIVPFTENQLKCKCLDIENLHVVIRIFSFLFVQCHQRTVNRVNPCERSKRRELWFGLSL